MTVKVVIDCNVLISAGISDGTCRLALIKALDEYTLILTPNILEEYKAVADRRKFIKYRNTLVEMISILEESAEMVEDTPLEHTNLPDLDDEMYIDAAINSKAKYLVTGNMKDFPAGIYGEVEVITPSYFLAHLSAFLSAL